jgi:hypothetical protein
VKVRRHLGGPEEGLAEPDHAVVRVEAHEAEVGELAELDRLERRDLHASPDAVDLLTEVDA